MNKVCIDTTKYGMIQLILGTLCTADWHVSIMVLIVESKRISSIAVSLLALSECISCWLASVHIANCCAPKNQKTPTFVR